MSWNVLGHSDYFSDCRGCCKKVQNTRPESKKMSLSTSWGSQFLWFWSNLHTNCFPVICPTSKFRKISFGEDTTLSEWAVAEKVSNFSIFRTSWHCMSLWLSLSGNNWRVRCFALNACGSAQRLQRTLDGCRPISQSRARSDWVLDPLTPKFQSSKSTFQGGRKHCG